MAQRLGTSALVALFFGLAYTSAACAGTPSDVPAGHWAAAAVAEMTAAKVMQPLSDGKFHGDQPVTRYELAVTLDKFVHYIEQSRKPLHVSQFPKVVPAHASPEQQKAFAFLTSQGFLLPNASILKGGNKALATADDLATSIAMVSTMLNDRALPPTKLD